MTKNIAKVVVLNSKNQILLLMRGSSAPTKALTWDLPGGVVKSDEEPLTGAIRELGEETGLVPVHIETMQVSKSPSGASWHYYLAKLHWDDPIKISWEHDEFIWIDLKDIKHQSLLPKHYKRDIKKVLKTGGYL